MFCNFSKHEFLEQEASAMVAATRRTNEDSAARIVLISIVAITIGLLTDHHFVYCWLGFYVLSTVHIFATLQRYRSKPTVARLVWALTSHCLDSVGYFLLICWLWLQSGPDLKIVAFCMVGAALMLVMTNRGIVQTWLVTNFFGVNISLTLFWSSLLFTENYVRTDIISIIALCSLQIYFVYSALENFHIKSQNAVNRQRRIDAQKMEAIGRLSGGVAHDFNNILTVIMGNLDLHKETQDPEEKEEFISNARQASENAKDLIAQLLAFSRKSSLAPQSIDCNELLSDAISVFGRTMPEYKNINMRSTAQSAPVLADRNLLMSALLNLLLNARDATDHKSGQIEMWAFDCPRSADAGQPGNQFVCICVHDNGTGIPNAALDQIFDPFFTTKEIGEGSGLGLSMVKGFAEQSGGSVAVNSIEGIGTTVTLRLPAAPESPKESA